MLCRNKFYVVLYIRGTKNKGRRFFIYTLSDFLKNNPFDGIELITKNTDFSKIPVESGICYRASGG